MELNIASKGSKYLVQDKKARLLYTVKKEHRRIASQRITIAAIRVLDTEQQNRLQDILDHIAYDKEYYMPERGRGMHY